jgi:DNA invertase Pin-like site-specific DNA recombinase
MTSIGYAHVSTEEQSIGLQLDALRQAGCERIERDQGVSGSTTTRPGLDKALAALQAGDTLCVWRLDRLGRSLPHLLDIVELLKARGVQFRSLTEAIDTSTASGELVFHLFGALAQFERSLIRERVSAGMKAAQARGQHCGRPAGLTPSQIKHARELREQGKSTREIGRLFKVSHSAVVRGLSRAAA